MAARETDIIMDFIVNNKDLYETNKEINETVKEARNAGRQAKKMSSYYSDGYGEWRTKQKLLTDESRAMQHEMKYGWMQNSAAFGKVLNDQIKARYGFYQLAKAGADYAGTNKQLMNDIYAQGAALKKVKDERIRLNLRMRQSFMEEAGMFANMTTQAQRISDNYSRMMNPLYMVNKGHLALANSLNKVANNGNAANLALRMLGKGADTKQLNDMVMMINQGLMRFNMIALGSVFTTYLFYGALHKLSMENKAYESSFSRMTKALFQAFKPMITVFQQVAISVFDFVTKIANMISKFNQAHPTLAKFLQGILLLIPVLTLLLSPLAIGIGLFGGFQAALAGLWMFIGPVVTGLAAMSATVWVVAAAIMGAAIAIQKLGGVGNTFDFLKQKAVDGFNAIRDAIKDFMSGGLDSAIMVLKTVFPTVLGAAIGGIPGLIVGLFARFFPLIGQVVNSGGTQLSNAITNIFSKIILFIQNQLPQYLTMGLMMVQNIVLGIIQAAPQFLQGIMTLIQGIIPQIQALLPVLLQVGLQIVMQLGVGLLQAVVALVPVLIQFIQQIIAVITAMLPTFINVGIQMITMLINGVVQMLPGLIGTALQLVQTILNAIVTYLPMILNAGVRLVVALATGILNNLPMIVSTIIRVMTQLVVAIIRLLPTVLSAGVKITLMLVQGIISMIGSVISAAGQLGSSLMSKLRSIDLASIGRFIMQGFLNGITSMFGAIKNAVSNIASSVMSVVRKVTNTHSPSREMFALGEYQSEGFALGIQERQKWVDKAAYNLAMAPLQAPEAVSAANTVNTTNNSNSNSLVFAPKITVQGGTGDGQRVASNVRDELEGLFGDMMNSFNMGAV